MRAVIIGWFVALLPLWAGAESVTDLQPQANGTYLMKIEGSRYVALSAADADQAIQALQENARLQQRLEEALGKLEQYQQLAGDYDALKGQYLTLTGDYQTLTENAIRLGGDYAVAADRLVTLNQDYSHLVSDYDRLTEKYRDIAVRSQPREVIDIGIGAVTSDSQTHGIVMVGAGTHLFNVALRGWLFGGPQHYGVMVGSSF